MLENIQKEVEDLRVKVYSGQSNEDTEKALYEIEQLLFKAMDKQLILHGVGTRSFNELEMLAEDLECVKMWLDDKKAPKTDSNGNEYSVVGRIQCLLNVCQQPDN